MTGKKIFRLYKVSTDVEYIDVEISEVEYGEMWNSNDHKTLAYYKAKSVRNSEWIFQEGTYVILKNPIKEQK